MFRSLLVVWYLEPPRDNSDSEGGPILQGIFGSDPKVGPKLELPTKHIYTSADLASTQEKDLRVSLVLRTRSPPQTSVAESGSVHSGQDLGLAADTFGCGLQASS